MRATKPTVSNLRNAIDSTCCDRPQVRTATEVLESNQPDPTLPGCPSVRVVTFQHIPAMFIKDGPRGPVSVRAGEFESSELEAIAAWQRENPL